VTAPARSGAFTELEIELVLLRRMADLQEPLVEAALARLGSSRSGMRAANKRWNAAGFGRPGPLRHSRFARALGTPVVDHGPGLVDAGMFRSCWPLPLWPGLWLQVLVDEHDVVWHHGLVRASDAVGPRLATITDVVPWSCVLPECVAAFDDLTLHDVGLSGHEAITCTAPGDDGEPARWLIRGIWGLVQTVAPSVI
jgi:hypothetical protein